MQVVDEVHEPQLERTAEEVWQAALPMLKKNIKTASFEMWIAPAILRSITELDAEVVVFNDFHRDMIVRSKEVIAEAISDVLQRPIQLKIVLDETAKRATTAYAPSIATLPVIQKTSASVNSVVEAPAQTHDSFQQDMRVQASNLNHKYTLDKFVVGSHNRFCYSAAMAVAERPGEAYNPLFIYGGVGLGKTHIMQAVGHHVMKTNPKAVVRYITCERFTNDLVNSIRENRMIDFRKRYRQADVLLVDDIQFIEGKESTQEEFFHTFNTLRDSGRQIILSSDRAPKDLPKLEERLRSRFEWGLIADIQPPDLETRLAILRKKCEAERMIVSDAVLEYIATAFVNNIRELEGALLRAHAYANLNGSPLNLQTAASVLQVGKPAAQKPNVSVENIISAVASHYRLDTSDLRSAKRSKDLAWPRHIAMYLAHDILQMSHSRIGESFGNRKHSSVIYAIDKIKVEMAENVQVSQAIQQIRRQLGV